MKKKGGFYSGYYKIKNKQKYVGNLGTGIRFRSSWERGFCKWCDFNDKVIGWAIEPFSINYYDIGTRKYRKYYPDFYIKMETDDKYLIEIKPDHETRSPKMKKGTKRFVIAETTFLTNSSKWKAAQQYCDKRQWEFKIVTEHTLNKLNIKIQNKLPKQKKRKRIKKK